MPVFVKGYVRAGKRVSSYARKSGMKRVDRVRNLFTRSQSALVKKTHQVGFANMNSSRRVLQLKSRTARLQREYLRLGGKFSF